MDGSVSCSLGSSVSKVRLLELAVQIKGFHFGALVDSGATHEFISERAV